MIALAAPTADWRASCQSRAALAILIGALVFNAVLCFLNTAGFPVTSGTVIGVEIVLLLAALTFALDARAGPWLAIAGIAAYALLLLALRGSTDVKLVRDYLIPIAFYNLGLRAPDLRDADRAALACGLIVVAMGLFEYAAFDVYERFFNIVRYYIARGSMLPSEVNEYAGTLFASGIRGNGRTLLPFLGPHRASSVFLEPVSAGNFGAVLFAWALYRPAMRGRLWLFACAAVTLVLADARFGSYVCVAIAAAMLAAYRLPRFLWVALPFAILLGLAIYGFESTQVRWEDDMAGRVLWSGRLVISLPPEAVFGIGTGMGFLADSGYASTLYDVGAAGIVGVWLLFILMPARDPRAWRLRCGIATYLCLLLVVSVSAFTIKTAALLWFVLGAADAADPAESSSGPARPLT